MEKKRLYKSSDNVVLCGVCGGVGEYFDVDPVVIRIAWVVFSCLGFSGVVAYIIAAIIMPKRTATSAYREAEEQRMKEAYETTYKVGDDK